MTLLGGAAGRAARGARAPGVHARLVDRAAQRLLCAPGVPGRQRARAGGDHPPLSAPGGRALRGGEAHEDPRPSGVGSVLPRRWPSAWRCPSGCAPRRLRTCARMRRRCSETERVLASVIEAVIGACYLHAGYERTAEAVVEAFGPEIEQALEHPVDFKSALAGAAGSAWRGGELRGDGRGRSAARAHLRGGGEGRRARRWEAGAGAARSMRSRRRRGRRWRGSESR